MIQFRFRAHVSIRQPIGYLRPPKGDGLMPTERPIPPAADRRSRSRPGFRIAGTVGLGLLGVLLAWWACPSHRLPSTAIPPPRIGPAPNTPFGTTLREARRWRGRAVTAVQYEGLASDEAGTGVPREPLRLQQMARDERGYLRRALVGARRAAALAHTTDEKYRAIALLACIEHEAGHHEAELQQAQQLVRLRPRNWHPLIILRRAAACNGLEPLERQADETIVALSERDSAAGLLGERLHSGSDRAVPTPALPRRR
jgi:hypothetical protein